MEDPIEERLDKEDSVAPRTWHIATTRSRSEQKAALRMERLSIPYYLPLVKELRQWSDRRKWVERPLFPSYIFVQVSLQEYAEVLAIPGIAGYVRLQGRAVAVPEARMADIRKAVESQRLVDVVPFAPVVGQVITLTEGALKGIKGRVVETDGKHYLLLAVEELGKYLKLKIQPEEL